MHTKQLSVGEALELCSESKNKPTQRASAATRGGESDTGAQQACGGQLGPRCAVSGVVHKTWNRRVDARMMLLAKQWGGRPRARGAADPSRGLEAGRGGGRWWQRTRRTAGAVAPLRVCTDESIKRPRCRARSTVVTSDKGARLLGGLPLNSTPSSKTFYLKTRLF